MVSLRSTPPRRKIGGLQVRVSKGEIGRQSGALFTSLLSQRPKVDIDLLRQGENFPRVKYQIPQQTLGLGVKVTVYGVPRLKHAPAMVEFKLLAIVPLSGNCSLFERRSKKQ
jgi:hypothetical protein